MLGRSLSLLAVAGACFTLGALPAASWAGTAAAPAASKPIDATALQGLLRRMHAAATERNYTGLYVMSDGGSVVSARIAHYRNGGNQFEYVETKDGQWRQVFRHNTVVHTFWPKAHVVLVEKRSLLDLPKGPLAVGEERLVESYEARSLGDERVAGLEADLIELIPRDEARYAHRLWTDKASGLLLRTEVLGKKSKVLESAAFSEVAIDVTPQPDAVLKPMKRTEGYRVVEATQATTTLEAEGWSLTPPVSGFRQVSCVRRPVSDPGSPSASDPPPLALQLVFSDGMTFVSVFIETFDAERHVATAARSGATATLARRQGDAWVTVVGDVPESTLQRFAEALTRKP